MAGAHHTSGPQGQEASRLLARARLFCLGRTYVTQGALAARLGVDDSVAGKLLRALRQEGVIIGPFYRDPGNDPWTGERGREGGTWIVYEPEGQQPGAG